MSVECECEHCRFGSGSATLLFGFVEKYIRMFLRPGSVGFLFFLLLGSFLCVVVSFGGLVGLWKGV